MVRVLTAGLLSIVILAGCGRTGTSVTPAESVASPPHVQSSPSAAPSPSASPRSAGSDVTAASCPLGVQGEAGRYRFSATDAFVGLEMTFPEGWSGCSLFFKSMPDERVGTRVAMVGFWLVDNVYTDPCQWNGALLDPPVGPSVEDLAAALERQQLTSAETSPITVDGRPGLRVTFAVQDGIDVSGCDRTNMAEFRYWDGARLDDQGRVFNDGSVFWLPAIDAPGRINEAVIVDVDGVRYVLQTAWTAGMDRIIRQELRTIVESVHFLTG
jgi:hypothetical protein